jgi:hypothetical protein
MSRDALRVSAEPLITQTFLLTSARRMHDKRNRTQ